MAKIVHFELPVDDAERAAAFYTEVLGWQINRFGANPYWLVTAGPDHEPGANGALVARDDTHACPVVVAGVDQLDKSLTQVRERGGTVVQEKLPVPRVGWSAYVRDPEGNLIGLFQPDAAAG